MMVCYEKEVLQNFTSVHTMKVFKGKKTKHQNPVLTPRVKRISNSKNFTNEIPCLKFALK